jgi:hypothetical protein
MWDGAALSPAKTAMLATAALNTGDVRITTGAFEMVLVPTSCADAAGCAAFGADTRALAARPVAIMETTVPVAMRERYLNIVKRGRMASESGSWTSGGEKKSGTPLL